jgi:formate-dependent nitrite reductase membrane component NrfD
MWANRRGEDIPDYPTVRFDPGNSAGTAAPAPAGPKPPAEWTAADLPPAATAQALAAAALQGEADFYTGAWAGLAPTRTVYDVAHTESPWGWKVSAYLWTKSISAGSLLVAALAPWLDVSGNLATAAAPFIGLVFLALTGILLVADLKRPARFWTILTRPNWDSWLARGAFIIGLFALLSVGWVAAALLDYFERDVGATGLVLLRWPLVAAALATAGYSGYLFAQARGRDFWQNPLLPIHFCVQAIAAGTAVIVLVLSHSPEHSHRAALVLAVSIAVLLGMIAFGELLVPHSTRDGAYAARTMVRGRYAKLFWGSMTGFGLALACSLLAEPVGPPAVLGGIATLVGLALYEHAWNLSGQAPPLS